MINAGRLTLRRTTAVARRHHSKRGRHFQAVTRMAGFVEKFEDALSFKGSWLTFSPPVDHRVCWAGPFQDNASMDQNANLAALDKLKTRIKALRAKTLDNGCTEDEALSAAAKVAELLDRHDLSLTDLEMREAPCERRTYETHRKKRIPLDDCIGAIANFCDCRVWREKNPAGESRYVFFGLRADIEVAHYLTELLDTAVRSELGRYKTTPDYRRFRHNERHLVNASFALGMVASIADKLTAMKAGRDKVNNSTGRGLVVIKASIVDAEFGKLDLNLRTQRGRGRMVSLTAYEAGGVAGASLAINPAIGDAAN